MADVWEGEPATGKVLFDTTRATGGERYQSSLVELQDVRIVEAGAGWTPNSHVTVEDIAGRHFPLRLGLNDQFQAPALPKGWFSVTGIFNQEASSQENATDGYELWVMEPASVLSVTLSADINSDGAVNLSDFGLLKANFGNDNSTYLQGNIDGVGGVDLTDFGLLKSQFGVNAVPEPSTWLLAIMGALLSLCWRRPL